MTYDAGTVVVAGGYEERIDTSPVADEAVGEPSWTARDGFLVLSFAHADAAGAAL